MKQLVPAVQLFQVRNVRTIISPMSQPKLVEPKERRRKEITGLRNRLLLSNRLGNNEEEET